MTQPTFQLDAEHRQPIGEAISEWFGQRDDSDGQPLLKLIDYTDSRNIDELIDQAILPTLGAIVAAVRPTLEGFRRTLLAPREIVRAADGSLTHPALPLLDENVKFTLFLASFGVETRLVSMEDDVDVDRYEEFQNTGSGNFSSWTPTAPEGDGWMLISMWEWEDGPLALYAREAKGQSRRRRLVNLGEKSRMKERRWCPDQCPLTARSFFMWLDHPELGYVPTYGGPFDSYTIAEPDEDGYYRAERYDHDAGAWVEGGEPVHLRDELLAAVEVEDAMLAPAEPAPPARGTYQYADTGALETGENHV